MQVRVALRRSAAPFTAGEAVESERFEFPGTQGLSAPNVLCAMIPPGARGVHGQHLVLHIAAQKRSIITELAHTSKAQVKPKPTARDCFLLLLQRTAHYRTDQRPEFARVCWRGGARRVAAVVGAQRIALRERRQGVRDRPEREAPGGQRQAVFSTEELLRCEGARCASGAGVLQARARTPQLLFIQSVMFSWVELKRGGRGERFKRVRAGQPRELFTPLFTPDSARRGQAKLNCATHAAPRT